MSGFVKRSTENVALPVSKISTPNVSQYGWTNLDVEKVNQLIGYVSAAKGYADLVDDAYYYFLDKAAELTTSMNLMHEEIVGASGVLSSVKAVEEQVRNYKAEVEAHVGNVQAIANLTTEAYVKIVDLVARIEPIKVYRGVWNLDVERKYPPTPASNSIWDISLSVPSYLHDGKVWGSGDSLVYLKGDDTVDPPITEHWQQIKTARY